ncbi:hypothetical protein HDU81_004956 [Chytriomyces hyalinus]|nr:hypothetical protein HDU81_004954 [Chytriomyces hyalinus]KAJ3229870.1 hypothetical protein HDU81_004956 [Chytriomyces hyalinus]
MNPTTAPAAPAARRRFLQQPMNPNILRISTLVVTFLATLYGLGLATSSGIGVQRAFSPNEFGSLFNILQRSLGGYFMLAGISSFLVVYRRVVRGVKVVGAAAVIGALAQVAMTVAVFVIVFMPETKDLFNRDCLGDIKGTTFLSGDEQKKFCVDYVDQFIFRICSSQVFLVLATIGSTFIVVKFTLEFSKNPSAFAQKEVELMPMYTNYAAQPVYPPPQQQQQYQQQPYPAVYPDQSATQLPVYREKEGQQQGEQQRV